MDHGVEARVERGKLEKVPELSRGNHAIYVGKMFGEDGRNIYDDTTLIALLSMGFERLARGERLQVKGLGLLSEMFNGAKALRGVLDVEGQKEKLRALSRKHFRRDDLDFIPLEKDPEHAILYEALNHADYVFNATEDGWEMDFHALFWPKNKPLVDALSQKTPNSLGLLRILYAAAMTEPSFRRALMACVPEKLRRENLDGPLTVEAYALVEIAIRLWDLANGRTVQGGIKRQEKYNAIILDLLKGRQGKFKNMTFLSPLFEATEGLVFCTLHLNNRENHFTELNGILAARRKSALAAAGLAGLVGGTYLASQQEEWQRRKELEQVIEAHIVECAKTARLRACEHDSWCRFNPAPNPYETLIDIVNKGVDELSVRYGFSGLDDLAVKGAWTDYLCDQGGERPLGAMHENRQTLIGELDRFVQKGTVFLGHQGLKPRRPYEDLLVHLDLFESARMDERDECLPGAAISGPIFPLGRFKSSEDFWEDYDLYLSEDESGERLWAFDPIHRCYSSNRGQEAAWQFLLTQEQYDLGVFNSKDSISFTSHWPYLHDSFVVDPTIEGWRLSTQKIQYRDFKDRWCYDVVLAARKSPPFEPITLARECGEIDYDAETARRLRALTDPIWNANFSKPSRNKYNGHSFPAKEEPPNSFGK